MNQTAIGAYHAARGHRTACHRRCRRPCHRARTTPRGVGTPIRPRLRHRRRKLTHGGAVGGRNRPSRPTARRRHARQPVDGGARRDRRVGPVRRLSPLTKRCLLIALEDWERPSTSLAIQNAIASGCIDHFLSKRGRRRTRYSIAQSQHFSRSGQILSCLTRKNRHCSPTVRRSTRLTSST
jgi:hypothetical protein